MKSLWFVLFSITSACVATAPGSSPDEGARRRDGAEDGEGGGPDVGLDNAGGAAERPAAPLPFTCEDVCDDGNEHDCLHGPCVGSACEVAPAADGSPCSGGDGRCVDGACVTGS